MNNPNETTRVYMLSLDDNQAVMDGRSRSYVILPDPRSELEMAVYEVSDGFLTEDDMDRKGVDVSMMEHLLKNYFDGLAIEVFVDEEGNRHPIIRRAQTENSYEEYI